MGDGDRGGARPALRRLLSYFRKYRSTLLLGALCVVGSAAFSLAKPLIVGNAVDTLRSATTQDVLVRFGLLYLGAAVVQAVFLFLQRRIVIGASRHIEYDMRSDFHRHLQTLPLGFYQEHKTGDLMSRATNDLGSVRMLVGPAVMHAFSSLLVVVGAFVMMMRLDAPLALMALLAVPVIAGLVQFFGQRIHDRFRAVQDYFGEISSRVQENLAGVRVVRAFGREGHEEEVFDAMNREYIARNRRLIRLTATFSPLLHALIGFLFIVVFFFGSRKILAGTMTVGTFVAFTFYLGRMVWPLIALGWVINLFQRGLASMKRLDEIWRVEGGVDRKGEVASLGAEGIEPSIAVRDLRLGCGERRGLDGVTIDVPAGTTLGIVGRTGSGKSTLLSLLTRTVAPPPGTIFVGGHAVEAIPLERLREMIGMVPQETFLFSDSIAENIRFGSHGAAVEEVQQAASLAGLGDDLASFSEGIGTVIGERGITLSGGQKQRTAIARAILKNPQILILDDALSAVDTQTEERILRSVRTLRQGRTAIIVSHRVSSVKDADQIIVLAEGKIAERGTHDELMARGGYYADLYRRQAIEEELEEIA